MTGTPSAVLPTEVDVIVVGAGGAGMTAALAAKRRGLDTVLLEKSDYFGGTTARSGGGVWIPGNYALVEAGQGDDPALSKQYLDAIVGDSSPKLNRDTFIDRGPEVMDFIKAETPLRFTWVPRLLRLPPRGSRRPAQGPQRRAHPAGRTLPGRRAGPAAPAVHEGAGQPDHHPGRLPQDQPRDAHHARAAHDPAGRAAAVLHAAARQEDVSRWATRSRSACARGWPTRTSPSSTAAT